MLPQIGGPEAAARHHADAGNAWFRLVEFGRQADHLVVGRNGVDRIRIRAQHLLEDGLADVHHLQVAVERHAVHALVAEVAVVQAERIVEVVERESPLGGIVVELGKQALGCEVAQPRREELHAVERRVARQRLGHDLVVHVAIGNGDEIDVDAGEVVEGLGALQRRFTVVRGDQEADGLACVFLADGFPVGGADPILLRIPHELVALEAVLLLIVLVDVAGHVDLGQDVGRVRQVLRIGAAHVEHRHATRTRHEGGTGTSRSLQQRATGHQPGFLELHHFPPLKRPESSFPFAMSGQTWTRSFRAIRDPGANRKRVWDGNTAIKPGKGLDTSRKSKPPIRGRPFFHGGVPHH